MNKKYEVLCLPGYIAGRSAARLKLWLSGVLVATGLILLEVPGSLGDERV